MTAAMETGVTGRPLRLLLAPSLIAVMVAILSCVQADWQCDAGCHSD